MFDAVIDQSQPHAQVEKPPRVHVVSQEETRNSRIGAHSLAVALLLAIQGGRVISVHEYQNVVI